MSFRCTRITAQSRPEKVPRGTARLDVRVGTCPDVLPDVLGVIARYGRTPLALEVSRLDVGHHIVLELDAWDEPGMERMMESIASHRTVESVRSTRIISSGKQLLFTN